MVDYSRWWIAVRVVNCGRWWWVALGGGGFWCWWIAVGGGGLREVVDCGSLRFVLPDCGSCGQIAVRAAGLQFVPAAGTFLRQI